MSTGDSMKKKLLVFLLITGMLSYMSISAGAAQTEISPISANVEIGVIAGDYEEVGSTLEPDGELPTAYSSADLGYTTPVRSQSYNTCWAYSATAIAEVALNMRGQGAGQLSPAHINYWGANEGQDYGWNRSIYDGGYPYISLGYMTSTGFVPDGQFPVTASWDDYNTYGVKLKAYACANDIIYLESKDRDTIKTAILNYGAMVGNFHLNMNYYNNDNGAYFSNIGDIATSSLVGHAVAIVGWDDNYNRENFLETARPESNGAWLCKNSWGTGVNDGYTWISYEDTHLFDKRFGPSYAIRDITVMSQLEKVMQNEIYGATYEFTDIENRRPRASRMTYANVLDFSDGHNVIEKVTFESTSEGSDYDIYYIPVDDRGKPTDHTDDWVLLGSGTIEYEGYVCNDIEDFKVTDKKGAIAIQIKKTGDSNMIRIGVDEWLSSSFKDLFIPDADRGMSYIIGYDTEPMDLMDYYNTVLDDDIGGTFVIKALMNADWLNGDCDMDGELAILDATAIQRHLAELHRFNEVQQYYADFDRDEELTILDATRIQRALAFLPN